ncbi:DUF6090 family protein [Winogradskyella sp. MH6]|uniref:DUF6090 family protein n=1 Tax=Winogradskyella sp. MH6 TaxID=2929510 RepID=UPI001FB36956|nr:DUF6090 family protein [Winogradskyella sp. MH6]
MIKFFRHIRKNLINEGKTSKYLKYALGEIILVVIGILIALQINNWNEDHKGKKIAQLSMQALQFDLSKDVVALKKVIENSVQDSTKLGSIKRKMSRDDLTLDTLVNIARFEFNPWVPLSISFNNNTINSLRSTGNINLLPTEVQENLLSLDALQQGYLQSFSNDVGIYLDNTILYSKSYPFKDIGHIDSKSKLADSIWSKATMSGLGAELNGLVGVKYSNYYELISSLQNIQKETEILINLLRKYE